MVSDTEALDDFTNPGLTFHTGDTEDTEATANTISSRWTGNRTDQGTQQLITFLTAQADEAKRQAEAKDKQLDLVMQQMAEQNKLLQDRLLNQTPTPSTSQSTRTTKITEVSHHHLGTQQ